MISDRLETLRKAMKENGIDVYYFNTSDYHMSEYVAEYFKTIAYFSGFTGSLATLLVDKESAHIFVDGRYHVQADKQCLKNGVVVEKLGIKGVKDPTTFILDNYKDKVLGFDGKRTSIKFAKALVSKGIEVKSLDIYSNLIEARVPLSKNEIHEFSEMYAGVSRKNKIEIINHYLRGSCLIVNNLESIAYLLNLRSDDIEHTPVFLSYLVFLDSQVYLFVDSSRFSKKTLDYLFEDQVIVRPYNSYYEFLKIIKNKTVFLDETKVNFETFIRISSDNNVIDKRSIIEDMKAIKNETEQANMREAHIIDGVAVVKFLKWLSEVDKKTITEWDAAKKIDKLRFENGAYDLSFSSIVAYNENGALMHYSPDKGKAAQLDNRGTLLFDTGGQYNYGTTDITRTVSLGPVKPEVKKWFTLVLKSMFNLSELKFLKGMSGNQIDVIARKDLWAEGVDYRCGTGHGVGFNLAVHEGPPSIRYLHSEAKTEEVEFKPGMICSDEPGVYFEKQFGIRCENMILCKKEFENEYGEFLGFETLTLVPFDLELIDKKYLDQKTINVLNDYHKKVFETLSPRLDEDEVKFLKKITRKI